MTFDIFEKDQKTIDAVVRNFEIIGEAVAHLLSRAPDALPKNIPSREIIDMRNLIIREYFGMDIEIVWRTIEQDLLSLKKMFLM